MIKSIVEHIKENWYYLTIVFLLAALCLVLVMNNRIERRIENGMSEIEYLDSLDRYHKVFYDRKFNELRKENKQLYDSLKQYKDKVDFLLRFKYEKEYDTGIVEIVKTDTVYVSDEPRTFEYEGEPADTFSYKLRINSNTEPNWYSLSVRTKDEFTIVNKKTEGSSLNELTIEGGGGTISDVTAFSRKDNGKKLKDIVSVGPCVTAGYDVVNNKAGVMVGVGITIDLW